MVFRRRYRRRTRRRAYKKRRYYDKVIRAALPRMRTFFFKRNFDVGSLSGSSAGAASGGHSFQLSDIPNFAEFTALFDQYKICAVKVRVIPTQNVTQAAPTSVTAFNFGVRYAFVIDYDSSNSLGSFDDAREFGTVKIKQITKGMTRYFKPRVKSANENDSSTIVASGNRRTWLNTALTNIPHYGMRVIIEQLPAAGINVDLQFETTVYLAFRNVK